MKKKYIIYACIFGSVFFISLFALNYLNNSKPPVLQSNKEEPIKTEEPLKNEEKPVEDKKNKEEETKPKDETKENKDNNFSGEKADRAIIEELMNNYNIIYPNIVNHEDIALEYLNTVVLKDSPYYKEILQKIKSLRDKKAKISLEEFNINSISDVSKDKEVKVQVTEKYMISIGEKSSEESFNGMYIIKVSDTNMSIIRKEVK